MAIKHDTGIATEIIHQFDSKPELLVQVLHAFVDRYGFVSEEAIRQIADELNLSRADVHGVVSFYHDFRTTPPGKHTVMICQAEACQAMGSRELTAHAERKLRIEMHNTSEDGNVSLEPVYCLGNCACSPAVMIDDKVHGRVDAGKLDKLIDACRGSNDE
ncbi:MAG: formate dehydrogenase subunit gamma [Woeseiaceae bacterium]|nr:formate dehydrogenase subunit gamma [Woeseiaceae bacterium]